MELSTIMPIAITSAPIVTTLKVKSSMFIPIIVANREIGIALPTIRLARISPKKKNRTIMENNTPSASVLPTEERDEMIISLAL